MQEDRPVRLEKELKNLSYQVRKIGVNINQVVAKINAGYGDEENNIIVKLHICDDIHVCADKFSRAHA